MVSGYVIDYIVDNRGKATPHLTLGLHTYMGSSESIIHSVGLNVGPVSNDAIWWGRVSSRLQCHEESISTNFHNRCEMVGCTITNVRSSRERCTLFPPKDKNEGEKT